MFHGTAHVVLGSGLTIAGATFCLQLHQASLLPDARCPAGHRHGRRRGRRTHAGPRDHHGGHSVRQDARTQARRCGCADGARSAPRSFGGPAAILVATIALSLVGLLTLPGYKTNYNDRNYLPARHTGQRGIRGRRPALLAGPDEPGTAADRERPRPAQLGRLPGHRQDRQGRLQGARNLTRAGDHQARRQADRAHLDPVPDQHAGHHPEDDREVQPGPHGQHAQAGQRHADDHRQHGEDVLVDRADGGGHALDGRQDEGHDRRCGRITGPHR